MKCCSRLLNACRLPAFDTFRRDTQHRGFKYEARGPLNCIDQPPDGYLEFYTESPLKPTCVNKARPPHLRRWVVATQPPAVRMSWAQYRRAMPIPRNSRSCPQSDRSLSFAESASSMEMFERDNPPATLAGTPSLRTPSPPTPSSLHHRMPSGKTLPSTPSGYVSDNEQTHHSMHNNHAYKAAERTPFIPHRKKFTAKRAHASKIVKVPHLSFDKQDQTPQSTRKPATVLLKEYARREEEMLPADSPRAVLPSEDKNSLKRQLLKDSRSWIRRDLYHATEDDLHAVYPLPRRPADRIATEHSVDEALATLKDIADYECPYRREADMKLAVSVADARDLSNSAFLSMMPRGLRLGIEKIRAEKKEQASKKQSKPAKGADAARFNELRQFVFSERLPPNRSETPAATANDSSDMLKAVYEKLQEYGINRNDAYDLLLKIKATKAKGALENADHISVPSDMSLPTQPSPPVPVIFRATLRKEASPPLARTKVEGKIIAKVVESEKPVDPFPPFPGQVRLMAEAGLTPISSGGLLSEQFADGGNKGIAPPEKDSSKSPDQLPPSKKSQTALPTAATEAKPVPSPLPVTASKQESKQVADEDAISKAASNARLTPTPVKKITTLKSSAPLAPPKASKAEVPPAVTPPTDSTTPPTSKSPDQLPPIKKSQTALPTAATEAKPVPSPLPVTASKQESKQVADEDAISKAASNARLTPTPVKKITTLKPSAPLAPPKASKAEVPPAVTPPTDSTRPPTDSTRPPTDSTTPPTDSTTPPTDSTKKTDTIEETVKETKVTGETAAAQASASGDLTDPKDEWLDERAVAGTPVFVTNSRPQSPVARTPADVEGKAGEVTYKIRDLPSKTSSGLKPLQAPAPAVKKAPASPSVKDLAVLIGKQLGKPSSPIKSSTPILRKSSQEDKPKQPIDSVDTKSEQLPTTTDTVDKQSGATTTPSAAKEEQPDSMTDAKPAIASTGTGTPVVLKKSALLKSPAPSPPAKPSLKQAETSLPPKSPTVIDKADVSTSETKTAIDSSSMAADSNDVTPDLNETPVPKPPAPKLLAKSKVAPPSIPKVNSAAGPNGNPPVKTELNTKLLQPRELDQKQTASPEVESQVVLGAASGHESTDNTKPDKDEQRHSTSSGFFSPTTELGASDTGSVPSPSKQEANGSSSTPQIPVPKPSIDVSPKNVEEVKAERKESGDLARINSTPSLGSPKMSAGGLAALMRKRSELTRPQPAPQPVPRSNEESSSSSSITSAADLRAKLGLVPDDVTAKEQPASPLKSLSAKELFEAARERRALRKGEGSSEMKGKEPEVANNETSLSVASPVSGIESMINIIKDSGIVDASTTKKLADVLKQRSASIEKS